MVVWSTDQNRGVTGRTARMNAAIAESVRTYVPPRGLVSVPKLRVAIVEDSAIIRARLSEALAEIPNLEIVGHAETEADAIALLESASWDAAVLDLQLKQGTGLRVLQKLRQEGRPEHSKVIVFTNYAFPQYKDRSLMFGADFFFDKSREFHRVREVLADLASAISHS